jgi:hypothetical protein
MLNGSVEQSGNFVITEALFVVIDECMQVYACSFEYLLRVAAQRSDDLRGDFYRGGRHLTEITKSQRRIALI